MRIFKLFALISILTVSHYSCDSGMSAQQIIDQSIAVSGGEHYEKSLVQFNFRDRKYLVNHTTEQLEMNRTTYTDSSEIADIVWGKDFKRIINKEEVEVPDSMAIKYMESINSVIYFALLPYHLNDPAVKKEYLSMKTIEGKDYHKIQVTFEEEGGGIDFQDVYVYWINAATYKVDYLAYSFLVDGGGYRFRAAYNERIVGGIRFVDYINYKPIDTPNSVAELDDFLVNGKLEELSKIELKKITVSS